MNLMTVLPHNRELKRKPHEMGLQELMTRHGQAKEKEQYTWMLEIYKKFTIPLAAAAFVLVGVPLGITRRAEGKFSGVVYSLLIFVSYYVLVALTENVGRQFRVSPMLIAITPNILVALGGLWLLRHLNTEEQARTPGRWKYVMEKVLEKVK